MNKNAMVGLKIKQLRTKKKCTLKQLSEETGLSVGFLSQLERGLSSIAIDSLAKIADLLDVSLASFFDEEDETPSQNPVLHGFSREYSQVSPQIIQYMLSHKVEDFEILPRILQLLPMANSEDCTLEMYTHSGEEFIYVLEGIITVNIADKQYTLYPDDSIQMHSKSPHNWVNLTNKTAKILTINYPNPFAKPDADSWSTQAITHNPTLDMHIVNAPSTDTP